MKNTFATLLSQSSNFLAHKCLERHSLTMFISHKTCIGLMYAFVSLEELELQTHTYTHTHTQMQGEKKMFEQMCSMLNRTHTMCCKIKEPFGNINYVGICVRFVTTVKY